MAGLMRLLFFIFQPAHWALGLSRVSFGTLVLGSIVGFAPTSALVAFAGAPPRVAPRRIDPPPRAVYQGADHRAQVPTKGEKGRP